VSRTSLNCAILVFGTVTALAAADRQISFAKDIQPVFQKTCWNCHSASVQLSKLNLATRDAALKGGDHGPAIVPGSAQNSRLFRLVAGLEKPAMPIGGKLSADDIESIRLWIDQGAEWANTAPVVTTTNAIPDPPIRPQERNYWAFQLPVRPPVPVVAEARGSKNPIDAFILKALEDKGIKQAPQADRITLLRRAYLDLVGLPPTPAEASEFLNDKSPDAWEKVVDRLLASPHYGERWGRHWLDAARYADSQGFEHNFDRPNAWRYRDYVIRAFNEDKPYNDFIREQIAGDELPHVTNDSLIATGFLASYAKVGYREKDNPEFRYEYLDDNIATIGRGILGLTVQCARCHDHKFDPIRQADYYRLQASLFGFVETDHPLVSKEAAAEWQKKTDDVNARINQLRAQVRELDKPYRDRLLPAKYAKFPQNIQDAIAIPEEKRTPGQFLLANQVIQSVTVSDNEIDRIITPADRAAKQKHQAAMRQIEKERPEPIPMAMGVTDGDYRFTPDGPGDEPALGKGKKREAIEGSYLHTGPGQYQVPPSYFLIRGDVNSFGPETKPGFVKVITYGNPPTELPPPTPHTSGRRLALAEWLVSRDNPMTARVEVNRIWAHHFGRGIVGTLDNFGKMGEAPTNPELLDWLAVEFMDRGWSVKQMQRLIMTSESYTMASEFPESAALAANIAIDPVAKDPDDKLLWRYRVQRLDAEIIRDSILAVSGGLNLQMGGPPVFPVIPEEIVKSMYYGIWKQKDDGPSVWRRSVYIYRNRGLPFPLLDVFDLPNQNLACGARNVTTVPTQALTLMNDDFVLKQAQLFANRLEEAAPGDPSKQIDLAYQIALARAPGAEEKRLAVDFLKGHGMADLANVMLNLNEFLYVR
jgi:hypothetical protein